MCWVHLHIQLWVGVETFRAEGGSEVPGLCKQADEPITMHSVCRASEPTAAGPPSPPAISRDSAESGRTKCHQHSASCCFVLITKSSPPVTTETVESSWVSKSPNRQHLGKTKSNHLWSRKVWYYSIKGSVEMHDGGRWIEVLLFCTSPSSTSTQPFPEDLQVWNPPAAPQAPMVLMRLG